MNYLLSFVTEEREVTTGEDVDQLPPPLHLPDLLSLTKPPPDCPGLRVDNQRLLGPQSHGDVDCSSHKLETVDQAGFAQLPVVVGSEGENENISRLRSERGPVLLTELSPQYLLSPRHLELQQSAVPAHTESPHPALSPGCQRNARADPRPAAGWPRSRSGQ